MPKRDPLSLAELKVPDRDKMNSVMEALSDAGRAEFLRELYGAIAESSETNDHAPVQFVVNAWWVSRTFVQHPDFAASVDAATKSVDTDHHYDESELRDLLAPA